METILQADDNILEAINKFGLTNKLPNHIFGQMEKSVCLLFMTGDINTTEVKDWYYLRNEGMKQLPPTMGTLIPHIWRAHNMSLSKKPGMQLLLPTDYYWELMDDINYSDPEALLELHKCNCTTGSKGKPCSSHYHLEF